MNKKRKEQDQIDILKRIDLIDYKHIRNFSGMNDIENILFNQ